VPFDRDDEEGCKLKLSSETVFWWSAKRECTARGKLSWWWRGSASPPPIALTHLPARCRNTRRRLGVHSVRWGSYSGWNRLTWGRSGL